MEENEKQEDMISYGFSARHWQQIEAGRPIIVSTLLRICAVFETSAERLIHRLDRGNLRGLAPPLPANLHVAILHVPPYKTPDLCPGTLR